MRSCSFGEVVRTARDRSSRRLASRQKSKKCGADKPGKIHGFGDGPFLATFFSPVQTDRRCYPRQHWPVIELLPACGREGAPHHPPIFEALGNSSLTAAGVSDERTTVGGLSSYPQQAPSPLLSDYRELNPTPDISERFHVPFQSLTFNIVNSPARSSDASSNVSPPRVGSANAPRRVTATPSPASVSRRSRAAADRNTHSPSRRRRPATARCSFQAPLGSWHSQCRKWRSRSEIPCGCE